jgi:hypothetical protein
MIGVRTGGWRLPGGALVVGVWIALRRGRRWWSREIVFRLDRSSPVAYHVLRRRLVLRLIGVAVGIGEIVRDAAVQIANRMKARRTGTGQDAGATG